MGMSERRKGQAGEREVAAILRKRGLEAKRGYQSRGAEEADVVHSIPQVRLEVKRTERSSPLAWMKQAERDLDPADDVTTPVVVWRPSRSRWYAIMPFEDWLDQMGYCEEEGGEG